MSGSFPTYLSYTGFKTYNTCPQQYYLNYIAKKRPDVEDERNVLNGIALHDLMEAYLNGNEQDPQWLVENVEEFWHQTQVGKFIVFRHENDADELLAKIKKWAAALADLMREHDLTPARCTPEFKADTRVDIHGESIKLGGRIDVMLTNTKGNKVFFDLKASENRQVMQFDQIVWYALVLGIYLQDHSQPQAGGYLLPGFEEITLYEVPMSAKQKMIDRIWAVMNNIKDEEFEPAPDNSKCFWCSVKHVCPVKGGLMPEGTGIVDLGATNG